MGVYIKGFEIEEDHACIRCRLSTKTAFDKLPFCDVTMKDIEDWSKRPEWCPLVSVPAHGRLIDADALVRDNGIKEIPEYYEVILEASTVLPAEPGEEGTT